MGRSLPSDGDGDDVVVSNLAWDRDGTGWFGESMIQISRRSIESV